MRLFFNKIIVNKKKDLEKMILFKKKHKMRLSKNTIVWIKKTRT